jgi:hypothetical protein
MHRQSLLDEFPAEQPSICVTDAQLKTVNPLVIVEVERTTLPEVVNLTLTFLAAVVVPLPTKLVDSIVDV